MSIVVVGGPSKGAGKTTLICGIVAGLQEREWTAIKITSHAYRGVSITEETARDPATDTGRYLLAGARRALLVEAPGEEPLAALAREMRGQSGNLIFESNRIASYLTPDLCLVALAENSLPVKPSFAAFLAGAHAFVARTGVPEPAYARRPGVPLFWMEDFGCVSPELLGWMRARLSPQAHSETAQS